MLESEGMRTTLVPLPGRLEERAGAFRLEPDAAIGFEGPDSARATASTTWRIRAPARWPRCSGPPRGAAATRTSWSASPRTARFRVQGVNARPRP